MQRYFVKHTLQVGQTITTTPDLYKHAITVMRLAINNEVELVDDTQHVFLGKLITDDKTTHQAQLLITADITKVVEMPIDITIACGIPKGDKAETIVQKGTQLGAKRFLFLNTVYSVAKWIGNKQTKKQARLQKIAFEAAQQAHRTFVPEVQVLTDFEQLLHYPATQKLVAYEESAKQGETAQLVKTFTAMQPQQSLLAFFGPEGGIAPQEIAQLQANQFKLAGLGPRILRAETAPLYLLAAASYHFELRH
ncbi:MAG: 16S rRNA (uracil(1498)-N(3))-methyltransferase [Candidatus Paralactobacillus gallistercoris]|uniref:Ribosomal RNA small subunit methyltransferase E n=1 Tax=Candidatus Paralactobacillus gallistercoris TaxID=2838724 RepID=A0A948X0Z1_9LACO|nr:16S rRNA (uracil(1498)-N(3))-methyltransferase [Candidatus Paralactobacillus gallistercoris]